MSSSRRSGSSKADASKDVPVPASPEKNEKTGKKRKQPSNEAEAAANDAAKEIAYLGDGTEPTTSRESRLPDGLLQRRLEKSISAVEQLQKEKADMAKQMEEMREEVKAAKLAKVVESASPGTVIQVGRQVFHIRCLQYYGTITVSKL
jgi:hypothetical protein